MQFRNDINGLRAIAVTAVVLFHFNPSLIPGGFAGVDVFFVISGFLMTGIIFRGLELGSFSVLNFYVARANRIIPALAALCLVLLVLGLLFLTPFDYKVLSKHIASSMLFVSNVIYWRESGYFDVESHGKWLLHSWSLSVEWQFYIIYPVVLVFLRKHISLNSLKIFILIGTVLGFILCVVATYKWPNPAYYLIPTRAWEMMLGGLAYLYPIKVMDKKKRYLEWLGLALVFVSYFFMSSDDPWPGFLSFFPVLGSFLIILAKRQDSLITGNLFFQKIGSWSYSIYLWHWPIVVAIYYFSLDDRFIYAGILLSILMGYLSNKYVEGIKFKNSFDGLASYLRCKPLLIALLVSSLSSYIYLENGFIRFATVEYQTLVGHVKQSPYRDECHINEYQDPVKACEYFGGDISWAVLGDSHSTEIAYALAEKLKPSDIGVKHFSFSACPSSYMEPESFANCSKWYNEVVNYILNDSNIENVVLNHRYTFYSFGGDASGYPISNSSNVTDESLHSANRIDALISLLASKKKNVYVFYPIPELPRNIHQIIGMAYRDNRSFDNIVGTDLFWFNDRNSFFISHFDNASYPKNVHLLRSQDIFCDEKFCYGVRDGIPLYFDDHHPSISGASKLIELIQPFPGAKQ